MRPVTLHQAIRPPVTLHQAITPRIPVHSPGSPYPARKASRSVIHSMAERDRVQNRGRLAYWPRWPRWTRWPSLLQRDLHRLDEHRAERHLLAVDGDAGVGAERHRHQDVDAWRERRRGEAADVARRVARRRQHRQHVGGAQHALEYALGAPWRQREATRVLVHTGQLPCEKTHEERVNTSTSIFTEPSGALNQNRLF